MFTGIVEELGTVKSIARGSSSIRLTINCKKILGDVRTGDSIAVNGICLTVTNVHGSSFAADVMPETMRRTSLSALKVSDRVNLERALRMPDRFGGHIVSGHIDGTGTIIGRTAEDNAVWLTIGAPAEILKYVVMKGSVALDGTSLTVALLDNQAFSVSLIPLTEGVTTLGLKKQGDIVNIECDMLGKYVEKLACSSAHSASDNGGGSQKSSITLDFLKTHGFA